MLNTDRVRVGYDHIASQYAARRDQASSVPFLEKLNVQFGIGRLILDLGCGAGLPVDRWLIDHGHRVIGVDISAAMLTLARENVPEASYQLRDMATLKEGDYSVDAVVSFFAMFHIDRHRHRALLYRIRSYLQEGGIFLVTTGDSDWEGEEDFLGCLQRQHVRLLRKGLRLALRRPKRCGYAVSARYLLSGGRPERH